MILSIKNLKLHMLSINEVRYKKYELSFTVPFNNLGYILDQNINFIGNHSSASCTLYFLKKEKVPMFPYQSIKW